MKAIETDAAIYVIFYHHSDFVGYINTTIPGKHLDAGICVPALCEVKPPHRIFVNLECVINYPKQNVFCWEQLNDEIKDEILIDFLITNLNHESLHKAIFEAPEIIFHLKEVSYQLNEAANNDMEYIIAKIKRE